MNDAVNVGSYAYVGDNEYLIIDKGTPDEMFAKYNKRLNATERGIYNDGEYNGLDTILVGQSGGMSTLLYFFREDDVDEIIYRDYFLSSVKFHLEKSINELKECSKSANEILTNERQAIVDEIDKAMAILSDLKITCDSI